MKINGQIKAIATLVLAGVIPHCAIAQQNEICFQTPGGQHIRVSAVSDNIIKVSNWNAGETLPETATSVLKGQSGTSSVSTAPGICVMTTGGGIVVRVDSLTGSVDISAGPKRSVSDNGLRTLADGQRRLELSTVGGGSFYGAGERGYSFNLAGDTLVMYNKQNYGYTAGEERIRQMNITMPLFLSSNGYAVVFDDFAAASMIMSNPIVYTSESRSPVSYYFINGAGSLASVTQELSALTGRQKLPPFWALGYITSKYGYHTQQETLGVVDTLKRAGYPLDGIVLDLYRRRRAHPSDEHHHAAVSLVKRLCGCIRRLCSRQYDHVESDCLHKRITVTRFILFHQRRRITRFGDTRTVSAYRPTETPPVLGARIHNFKIRLSHPAGDSRCGRHSKTGRLSA